MNALAPINKIPPETLTLLPEFCHSDGDSHLIALTHVCHAWREMFTSCPSLWTHLDCGNADKTRVYLERSKSSPVHLRLFRYNRLLPHDPFFETDPPVISRLRSLDVRGQLEHVQEIALRLSYPAPLLQSLTMQSDPLPEGEPWDLTTLFDGDLSSLRDLCLLTGCTELPWRNMVNLTSFLPCFARHGGISTTKLLDFFEGAPHLQEVGLYYISLIPINQNQRLVSLTCLKKLFIRDRQPASLLIGHLLIPVGATLHTEIQFHSRVEDHLPRSLDNLRNLANFTQLRLRPEDPGLDVEFVGPNGEVSITSTYSMVVPTGVVREFLDWFDTSTVEVLEITSHDHLPQDLAYRLLLPMKSLRTLTISPCNTLCPCIHALNPDVNLEGVLVCPRLEKLVFGTSEEEELDTEGTEVARAARGAKVELVQITLDGVSDGED